MSKRIPNERSRLLRRRETLLSQLAEDNPAWVEAFESNERALFLHSHSDNDRYLYIREYADAFRAVLEWENRPLSAEEMIDKLLRGSFVVKASSEIRKRNLVKATLAKMPARKHLDRIDGLFYLPEWKGAHPTKAPLDK